jgi:flagellin-like protein
MSRAITPVITVLVLIAVVGWHRSAPAQQANSRTMVEAKDRYELVQAPGNANAIIRVDKFTGDTHFMETRSGQLGWRILKYEQTSSRTKVDSSRLNFQVVALEDGPTTALLWNVHTGVAWQVHFQPRTEPMWRRVLDPQ